MKSLLQAVPWSVRGQECLHDAQGPNGKQCRRLWVQFGDFDFTAARSTAAHGDDFTAIFANSHLQNSSPFALFSKFNPTIGKPIMRSAHWYPCPSVPQSWMGPRFLSDLPTIPIRWCIIVYYLCIIMYYLLFTFFRGNTLYYVCIISVLSYDSSVLPSPPVIHVLSCIIYVLTMYYRHFFKMQQILR